MLIKDIPPGKIFKFNGQLAFRAYDPINELLDIYTVIHIRQGETLIFKGEGASILHYLDI